MRVDGGAEGLALSVHGPAGVLDFVVPGGASAWDVAREYAEAAGLAAIPLIYTRTGEALAPDAVLAERGFASGDLLVAAVSAYRPPARRGHWSAPQHPRAGPRRTRRPARKSRLRRFDSRLHG